MTTVQVNLPAGRFYAVSWFIQQAVDGLWEVWRQAGGHAPTGFMCLTPSEFERASNSVTLVPAVLPEAFDLLPAPVPA